MANGIIWKDGTITYKNSKGEIISTPQPKSIKEMSKEVSKETRVEVAPRVETYKQFIDILGEMGKQGKIDAQTRWEIMSMAGELSHSSFVRGQDEGIKTMDKISKM